MPMAIVMCALHSMHGLFCSFVHFIMKLMYGKHGKSMPPIDDRLLLESATSLAEQIRTKQVKKSDAIGGIVTSSMVFHVHFVNFQITSTQVMNAFIKRIKQINPLLNCVVDECFKEARHEAAKVDVLIALNKYSIDELRESKPFLGVPMSTKDSIGVEDMKLTCGLWHRRNTIAPEDADTIKLLREAGAIPFAITNVPECCLWYSYALLARSYHLKSI